MKWKRIRAAMTELLWPKGRVCLACGVPTEDAPLCEACAALMAQTELPDTLCPRCAEPPPKCVCDSMPPPWDMALCACRYEGVPRDLVHALKFEACAEAGDMLAAAMADAFRASGEELPDGLVWPPTPAARQRERGIDHAAYLGQTVAKSLGCSVLQPLCRVKGQKGQQHTMDRAHRIENAGKLFDIAPNAPDLSGQTVLLVDDVMTTGATMIVCARLLKERLHARRIVVLTAARALVKSDAED